MTDHEKFCLENATHFSAVRGRGYKRSREDFNTFDAAKEFALQFNDGRTMIYAITESGSSAHIVNA